MTSAASSGVKPLLAKRIDWSWMYLYMSRWSSRNCTTFSLPQIGQECGP